MIVRELFARLGMDVDGSGFTKAQNALARLHLALGGLRDIARMVKGAIDGVVNGVAESSERLGHAAQITGLTTDKLQELEYAAKRSNVSAEELQLGLVHLARGAKEASMGAGTTAAAYFRLGVRVADANGRLRPTSDILGDVVARMARMPDGTEKAAIAMELFGRSGARLIPIINEGPAGLARLGAEARRLGVVMGGPALAAGQKYQAAHEQLAAAIQGVRNAIAEKLFPALTKSTANFREWLVIHREWIALKVKEAFELLRQVLDGLLRVGKGVADFFERIWRSGTLGKIALGGLAAIIVSMLSPMGTFAALLALIAEDVELFFSSGGKAKTITGLLVQAFKLLGAELNKLTGGFVEQFINDLKTLPDRIEEEGIGAGIVSALLGNRRRMTEAFGANAGRTQADDNWFGRLVRPGLQRIFGDPFAGAPLPSLNALSTVPPMLLRPDATPSGGSFFSATINVSATPGTDGQKVGEDIFDALRPRLEEWRAGELRTAADHVSKNRSR